MVKKKDIPIITQCRLIGLNRSSYYHIPIVKEYDDKLIYEILKIYEETPFYGYRKVTKLLQRRDFNIGEKEVKKLRKMLGLKTIYRAPKTTNMDYNHKIYPYLLRELEINKVNQVWSTDINLHTSRKRVYILNSSYRLV